MDTQNSSLIDAPHMKLAKVGKDRDRKRGGAGWLSGARGASGFSGALGGAGAGAGAGFMGTGMSLAKLLMVLLVSAGVSAGAWQLGSRLASNSASGAKTDAPKVFADKDQKYADTSGVIKAENTIPNSLGFINNDGMTAEQRAAKKAADDAAAAASAKAAADAQAKADADAKAKADADAKAAATANASAPPAAVPKIGLAGKFGSLSSAFGGSGGLNGGAGLSGGIARNFGGADGLGGKGQKGALGAFSTGAKVASTRAPTPVSKKSNSKGFLAPLETVAGMTSGSARAGTAEGAAGQAGTPFDNGAGQGTSIAGPGLGNGTQSGPADGGGSLNPGTNSGPIGSPANCTNGQQVDGNGNCVNIASPNGTAAAPYQGLIDAALLLITLCGVLSLISLMLKGSIITAHIAKMIDMMIAVLGGMIALMGIAIAAMPHGDYLIGGILAAVGGYICVSAAMNVGKISPTGTGPAAANQLAKIAAKDLIAEAIGGLAAGSSAAKSLMQG